MSLPINSRKVAHILKFKLRDPFHCQAELNFRALREFEKQKDLVSFSYLMELFVASFFFEDLFPVCPNWFCRLGTSVFSDEQDTSLRFMANFQTFISFLACYSQKLCSALTDELFICAVEDNPMCSVLLLCICRTLQNIIFPSSFIEAISSVVPS